MLAETICVPCAACCTLREISCVAAPCSSTAAAIAEEISRELSDGARDFLDGADRILGRCLDTGDLLTDLAGGLGGLFGQRLHFGRNDREATAGFTGACRLDGGVERKQVGLPRDVVDELDHVADAGGGFRQFADPIVGPRGLLHGVAGHPRRFLHLPADLVDRGRHFLGGRCDRLHVGGGLFRRPRRRWWRVPARAPLSRSACPRKPRVRSRPTTRFRRSRRSWLRTPA